MKCGSIEGPCSICETYAESASAYCCREDLGDQKDCSESQLRVIWTPKALIHTFGSNQSTSSHNLKNKEYFPRFHFVDLIILCLISYFSVVLLMLLKSCSS